MSLLTSKRVSRLLVTLLLSANIFISLDAYAVPPRIVIPSSDDDEMNTPSTGFFGFMSGINRSGNLLGDLWGFRKKLSQKGISLAILETSEYLGNTSGGTAKGFKYDGLTQVLMQMDTQRAFGHYGGLFNMSFLNIHGNNLSASNLQTLQTASGIETNRATRLWEMWYLQRFLDENRMDIKIGLQSLDQEFMVSTNALYFVNTMFGWPMLPSADMPDGGPAYPLSALGVRVYARPGPINSINIYAGIFNGLPLKSGDSSHTQWLNNHGLGFPLGNGPLAIAEVQYTYPSLGAMIEPDNPNPLGWKLRLGVWYDATSFSDQRFDVNGMSLANPSSNGIAAEHKGNGAVYGVLDQILWRDDSYPDRTVNWFFRGMGTPLKDRNLIDYSLNVGTVFHSPFRNRPYDTLGLGLGYAHVSHQATQLDRDNISYGNNVAGPVRSSETFVELTYQYQIKPWIQIQPDIQYVINPGGGIPQPDHPSTRVKDELVIGIRTNISI